MAQPLFASIGGRQGSIPFLPFPAYVNHRTITTAEDETVPADMAAVVIDPDADVWVANGTGAAVVPSTDVTNGTGSFLVKAGVITPAFGVSAGQKISVVSASGTAHVAFLYYGAAPV